MATKNLDGYKLGVVLDASGAAKGISALKDADKQATKTYSSLQNLSKNFKLGLAEKFQSELKQVEGLSRSSALGNILGRTVGQGMTDGLSSVFNAKTLGSIIGTAIAPGVGTVAGSIAGSAIDAAISKISGPLLAQIQNGIELNKQLEIAKLHFTSFTGSEKEATAHLDELRRLARDAGLDLPQLLQADQRLEEFNDDVRLSALELRAAADQSAKFFGSQQGFDNIANALGLIAEKGELTSKTLMKLQKSGIHVEQYLSEALGLSPAKIKELIAQGRLRGDVAAKIIAAGIEVHAGGYAQRVANNTLEGRQRQNQALQNDLAATGTEAAAGGMRDMYALANSLLASNQAQELVKFINDAAQGVILSTERAVKTGYDFSSGVVQGIVSGDVLGSLKSAAGTVGNTVIDELKSLWDIHSPSGVGKELGGNFVEGLHDGLVDRTSQGFDKWATALEKAGGDAFIKGVEGIAKRLGVDPSWLLNVMAFESSLNAHAANPTSSGRGLIQFMNPTARRMGLSGSDAFTHMSAMQQLPFVEKYFAPFAGDAQPGRRLLRSRRGPRRGAQRRALPRRLARVQREPRVGREPRRGHHVGRDRRARGEPRPLHEPRLHRKRSAGLAGQPRARLRRRGRFLRRRRRLSQPRHRAICRLERSGP